MRALLATAGLLVLAGSAAAGRPTAHTLRKSGGGPFEAVAQDNNLAAWFAAGTRPCNEVHVMSPGKKDRSLPAPSSDSMTCRWDISGGQSQLAIAARMSTALWTLHESGPSSFDQVLAASFGGPERQLERLTHTTNGIGDWLGGVAGPVGRSPTRGSTSSTSTRSRAFRAARASRRSPTAGSGSSRVRARSTRTRRCREQSPRSS